MPVYLEQTGRAAGGEVRVLRSEFSEKERRPTMCGTVAGLVPGERFDPFVPQNTKEVVCWRRTAFLRMIL